MTTKHEIEIEGLPEGWRAVAYRLPLKGEYYFFQTNFYRASFDHKNEECLIVEKIKPRRIVLEETEEVADTTQFMNTGDVQLHIQGNKIWKEVEEGE